MSNLLPSDWKVVRLEEVAEIQKGTSFTSKELEPGDVPVIAGGREPAYYHKYSNRPPNTITVSASGDAGYVSFHREPIFATDCTTVRSKPQVSVTNYIHHFLKYNQNKLYRLRTGSALPHLYPRDIAGFQVILPPLEEQISIADILDSVEEKIEQTENTINKTEQLRDSLLHELLTQGLPGYHKEWKKVSGLGSIPASWQVVRLGDIVDVVGGSTPSRECIEYWNGDIPWVVPSELTELPDQYLSSTNESITHKGLQSGGLKIIPANSVLLTTRATIGVVAINLIPVTTNQGFQNLIPKNETDVLWLYYYMKSKSSELNRRASGSTFKEVSRDNVRALSVAYPSLYEQRKISSFLDILDMCKVYSRDVMNLTNLFQFSLMNRLLTKPMSGA